MLGFKHEGCFVPRFEQSSTLGSPCEPRARLEHRRGCALLCAPRTTSAHHPTNPLSATKCPKTAMHPQHRATTAPPRRGRNARLDSKYGISKYAITIYAAHSAQPCPSRGSPGRHIPSISPVVRCSSSFCSSLPPSGAICCYRPFAT